MVKVILIERNKGLILIILKGAHNVVSPLFMALTLVVYKIILLYKRISINLRILMILLVILVKNKLNKNKNKKKYLSEKILFK